VAREKARPEANVKAKAKVIFIIIFLRKRWPGRKMIARVKIKSKCKIIFLCVNFCQGLKVLASSASRVKQKFFNKMFAFPQFRTLLRAVAVELQVLHPAARGESRKNHRTYIYSNVAERTRSNRPPER